MHGGDALAPDELLVAHLAFELGERPGAVGRVVDVGAELAGERDRLIDRLVALPALRSCGACLPCRRGHPATCARAQAPAIAPTGRVAARLAVVFGDALPPPDAPAPLAALAGTGMHAYAAVVRAGVEPNRAAVIVGRGPLALFVAAWVRHRGAEPIRCDGAGDAARVAETLAAHGIEPFAIPVIAAGPDAEAACALAAPGASVVLCGAPGDAPGVARLVAARGLSLHGHPGAHPDLLPELCAFVASGRFALAPLCRDPGDPLPAAVPGEMADERAALHLIG